MASSDNVNALGDGIEKLSDHLAGLSESPSRTISSVSAQLAFLLSLAVRKIAFGPNEWQEVDDNEVVEATNVIHATNEAAGSIQTGQEMLVFSRQVIDAIAALERLQ